MKDERIILCPKCKELANWNSHFQCYICEKCGRMIEKHLVRKDVTLL
jgi:hypothetical protein